MYTAYSEILKDSSGKDKMKTIKTLGFMKGF